MEKIQTKLLFSIFFSFILITCTPKTANVVTTGGPTEKSNEQPTLVTETPAKTEDSEKMGNLPFHPDVRTGQLENGLKYYLMKNNKPENRAELRLAVRAGSLQEDEDQLGIAHFVEHMAFNGSENFSKNELVDYLETVGTRFGPDLNAYTSFDETVYMLQVRTDDEEQLTKGMTVLQDWAGGLTFDPEEIDKERGVVVSEWRTGLSANQRMQQQYLPVMLKDSRYAERLPIGKPEIVEELGYDRIKQFYMDWYRPDLMAVSIVGNIDLDQMEKEIRSRFGKLKNPEVPRERVIYKVPIHDETLVSICSDKEATNSIIQLMYKHPEVEFKTEADLRQRITWGLYNTMLNNRLNELSQEANPPFIFAYSGFGGGFGHINNYTSFAMVPEGGIETGLQTLLRENERALRFGFTDSEMERAVIETTKSAERAVKEADKQESNRLISSLINHFLEEEPVLSPQQNLELVKKYLPTIQLEEINKLASTWIRDKSRVVIVTAPEKEGYRIPTENELLTIINDSKKEEITAYEDEVSTEPLFSKDLTPVMIKEEKNHDAINAKEIVLENGIRILYKKTDFKNDEIIMSARSDGGNTLYDLDKFNQARFASSIISQSGVGNFDEIQLGKLLTGKKVSVSPYIGGREEGFRGNASPEDLETLFQLIYLYFENPRRDEEALKSFVAKQKAFLENLDANPNFYFYDQVTKVKYGNHPRTKYPTVADMDALDLDQIMAIYEDRFQNAGDFIFYFVGNFDENVLKNYAREYLGNLPNTGRVEHWKDVGVKITEGKIRKNWNRGQAPKTNVQIFFHGPFEWSTNNRYVFNSTIDLLRIKLREALREDKGGVYGVGIQGSYAKEPRPEYTITITFNSDPDRTDELVKAVYATVNEVKENGGKEEDIVKVKELQKQTLIKSHEQNRYWLNGIRNCDENNLPFNSLLLEHLEELADLLSPQVIKSTVNQYFNEENSMEFVLNPEVTNEN